MGARGTDMHMVACLVGAAEGKMEGECTRLSVRTRGRRGEKGVGRTKKLIVSYEMQGKGAPPEMHLENGCRSGIQLSRAVVVLAKPEPRRVVRGTGWCRLQNGGFHVDSSAGAFKSLIVSGEVNAAA